MSPSTSPKTTRLAPVLEQQIVQPQQQLQREQEELAEQARRIEQIKRDQEKEKLLKQQKLELEALEREKAEAAADAEPQVLKKRRHSLTHILHFHFHSLSVNRCASPKYELVFTMNT